MEENSKGFRGNVFPSGHWLAALAENKALSGFSKETKEVITSVMDKIEDGVNPQIAFKEAIESAGLTGMEMDKMEKRTDIAAILYDLYEVDVNPVNIDKTTPEHAE